MVKEHVIFLNYFQAFISTGRPILGCPIKLNTCFPKETKSDCPVHILVIHPPYFHACYERYFV